MRQVAAKRGMEIGYGEDEGAGKVCGCEVYCCGGGGGGRDWRYMRSIGGREPLRLCGYGRLLGNGFNRQDSREYGSLPL